MARNSVRGTPYTHVKAGNSEGQSASKPVGYKGTVGNQYGDDQIQTGPSQGTPYNSHAGNGPESKRVVSQSKYGMVETNAAGNMSDPASNGAGVVLDGASAAGALDSPVPGNAPVFDPGYMETENRAHLGSGNEMGLRDLINGGGVMSRGMVGVSKSGQSETQMTTDDTLPSTAPAGRG